MEDCKELDMTLQEATHMTRDSRVWRATKERASDGIDWTIVDSKRPIRGHFLEGEVSRGG